MKATDEHLEFLDDLSKYLVDAFRPAQEAADTAMLPQTVFYHPDWGFAFAYPQAAILRDKQTQKFVTWLPSNFWATAQPANGYQRTTEAA